MNKKPLKVLSVGAILGSIMQISMPLSAEAAIDSYIIKVSKEIYSYNKVELVDNFLEYKLGNRAELYNDFTIKLRIANGFYAFHDRKKGYIKYEDVENRYLKSRTSNNRFNVESYIESRETKIIEVNWTKKAIVTVEGDIKYITRENNINGTSKVADENVINNKEKLNPKEDSNVVIKDEKLDNIITKKVEERKDDNDGNTNTISRNSTQRDTSTSTSSVSNTSSRRHKSSRKVSVQNINKQQQEAERQAQLKKEQEAREAQEKADALKKQQEEEKARVEKERQAKIIEEEKVKAEEAEKERVTKIESDKKVEAERIEKENQLKAEKLKQQQEAERQAQLKKEQEAREAQEKANALKKQQEEEKIRVEKERQAKLAEEARVKEEEKLKAEQAEKERVTKIEADKKAEAERIEKDDQVKEEKLKKEQEAREAQLKKEQEAREAQEKADALKKQQEEEKARIEKENQAKLQKEAEKRAEAEKLKQQQETERQAQLKKEQEAREAQEKADALKKQQEEEKIRVEKERQAKLQKEAEKRAEAEKLKQQQEAETQAQQKKEQAEKERLAKIEEEKQRVKDENNKLIEDAKNNINLGDLTNVKDNLTLPTKDSSGVKISWTSDDEATIKNDGTVTRPSSDSQDKNVKLVATFTKDEQTSTKEFAAIVKAQEKPKVKTRTEEIVDLLKEDKPIELKKPENFDIAVKEAVKQLKEKFEIVVPYSEYTKYNFNKYNNIMVELGGEDYGKPGVSMNGGTVTGDKATMTIILNYRRQPDEVKRQKKATEEAVKRIVREVVKEGMTDVQKELALHDYVVKHADYNMAGLAKQPGDLEDHSAYGVLVLGKGVCESYAKAMHLLLNEVGIDCKYATGYKKNPDGSQGGGHAWNMVKLDNDWYNLDATWDDPVSDRVGRSDKEVVVSPVSHAYFNVTDSVFNRDHIRGDFEQNNYPTANGTKYSYDNLDVDEFMNDGTKVPKVTSRDELIQEVKEAMKNRKTELYVRLKGFKMTMQELMTMLGQNLDGNIYKSYGVSPTDSSHAHCTFTLR